MAFQKNVYFCFIDYTKTFDCVNHNKLWKTLEETGVPGNLISWDTYIWVKKQHLEWDREQRTDSIVRKEYDKAVSCHLAYLTYT